MLKSRGRRNEKKQNKNKMNKNKNEDIIICKIE